MIIICNWLFSLNKIFKSAMFTQRKGKMLYFFSCRLLLFEDEKDGAGNIFISFALYLSKFYV